MAPQPMAVHTHPGVPFGAHAVALQAQFRPATARCHGATISNSNNGATAAWLKNRTIQCIKEVMITLMYKCYLLNHFQFVPFRNIKSCDAACKKSLGLD